MYNNNKISSEKKRKKKKVTIHLLFNYIKRSLTNKTFLHINILNIYDKIITIYF